MPSFTEIEDIRPDLLAEPLDFFFAEHYRHRQFCKLVNEVAGAAAFDAEAVARLLRFLREDLPVHVLDEEHDFFPVLRRRARPEDDIEVVLGRLSGEHEADIDLARAVRAHLEACLEAHQAPGDNPAARQALQDFASHELQHLALENAVVLPIARLRLTAKDLRAMSRRLAARRGLTVEPA